MPDIHVPKGTISNKSKVKKAAKQNSHPEPSYEENGSSEVGSTRR